MRRGYTIALVLTILFGLAYLWYYTEYLAPCRIPVRYSIGAIDERFNVTREEVHDALAAAEALWENASTQELFVYDEHSPFTVSLVYDERQGTTDEGEVARITLEDKQHMSESLRAEYEEKVAQYEREKQSYERDVAAYDARLRAHNAEVASWNEKGGAPEGVYAKLAKEQTDLAREADALSEVSRELNRRVTEINALGERGNQAVAQYNKDVAWYNQLFGTEREFTQGEYTGSGIVIYQFANDAELRRVLAHEMGHALSLDHVDGEKSVMHYLLEGKNADFALSSYDRAELGRVCEVREGWYEPLLRFLRSFVE